MRARYLSSVGFFNFGGVYAQTEDAETEVGAPVYAEFGCAPEEFVDGEADAWWH